MDFHLDSLLNLPNIVADNYSSTLDAIGSIPLCVDMWGGFPKVIREVFPNAKIVIDRFHVQKLINKALNKIRLTLKINGLKKSILVDEPS